MWTKRTGRRKTAPHKRLEARLARAVVVARHAREDGLRREGRRGGRGARSTLRGHPTAIDFAGPDLAVDLAALVQLDAPRLDLPVDDTRGLEFQSALRHDRALDLAADDGILSDDVAQDDPILPHDDGFARAHRPLQGALDPEGSFRVAVAHDAHARADDGDHTVVRGAGPRIALVLGHHAVLA